jgi:hypothetical protein
MIMNSLQVYEITTISGGSPVFYIDYIVNQLNCFFMEKLIELQRIIEQRIGSLREEVEFLCMNTIVLIWVEYTEIHL